MDSRTSATHPEHMTAHADSFSVRHTPHASPEGGGVVDRLTPLRLEIQRLRNTFRLNAFTSFVGGMVAAGVPGRVATVLGVHFPGWVRVVGLGLVGFSMSVFVTAGSRATRLRSLTPAIIVADVSWVLLSGVTIAAGWYSAGGNAVVLAVAGMVATFAFLQSRAYRSMRSTSASVSLTDINEAPPIEVAHVDRMMRAPIDHAWTVITDHELYGRLAPNLGAVHATSPNGPALERTCTNRAGEEWHEVCTLWTDRPGEEHRFDVEVDTNNYPYPLAEMRGSWWVRPTSNAQQVLVGMDFRFQPRRGFQGRIFAALMHAGFPPVLRRILNGWQRRMEDPTLR
jgi:hypothetical protein